MRGERGFALVIALIVTALLVALLVEFVSEVYVDTSHTKNFVASQQAEILAESGIYGGIQLLKLSSATRAGDYSSLSEMWAKPFPYETEVGTVLISIEEESGKLDLNSVVSETGFANEFSQKDTFLRLLANLKLSSELCDSLVDWLDKNDSPLPNGAESKYYLGLKPPYLAHNNRLDTLEELALVRGFTPEVLKKLRPYVTVYGSGKGTGQQTARININTAPKELLAALDDKLMRGDLVEHILERRKTMNLTSLNDVSGLETMAQLTSKANFKGTTYRIRSEMRVGESVSVAEAVVTNIEPSPGSKTNMLYWRMY